VGKRRERGKARVSACFALWIPRLGLDRWDIDITWQESRHPEDTDSSTLMDTTALWEYMTATIRVFLPPCIALEDDDLEKAVVHELVHCLVSPMEQVVPDEHSKECEFTVELLTRLMLKISD